VIDLLLWKLWIPTTLALASAIALVILEDGAPF